MIKKYSLALASLIFLVGCGGGGTSSTTNTIADITAPTITSSNPQNNDVNLAVSDNLVVTFSESMDTPSISNSNIILTRLSDNSVTATTVTYDDVTKTATINPDANLVNNTFYRITITTSVKDTSSNTLSSNQTVDFMVGDDITHKGYSYKVIKSPITGENWLDRNLGAYSVCTKSRDDGSFADNTAYTTNQQNCFGDYYQWGRNSDGHQEAISDNVNIPNKTASSTTILKATSYTNVGHSDTVSNSSSPFDWLENSIQDTNNIDDDGILRATQWSKIDGSSICPNDFRVPTSNELYLETISYSGEDNPTTGAIKITNRDTAFKNFLKFPSSGAKGNSLYGQGSFGYVWSTTINGVGAFSLNYGGAGVYTTPSSRIAGNNVRCIKATF